MSAAWLPVTVFSRIAWHRGGVQWKPSSQPGGDNRVRFNSKAELISLDGSLKGFFSQQPWSVVCHIRFQTHRSASNGVRSALFILCRAAWIGEAGPALLCPFNGRPAAGACFVRIGPLAHQVSENTRKQTAPVLMQDILWVFLLEFRRNAMSVFSYC